MRKLHDHSKTIAADPFTEATSRCPSSRETHGNESKIHAGRSRFNVDDELQATGDRHRPHHSRRHRNHTEGRQIQRAAVGSRPFRRHGPGTRCRAVSLSVAALSRDPAKSRRCYSHRSETSESWWKETPAAIPDEMSRTWRHLPPRVHIRRWRRQ